MTRVSRHILSLALAAGLTAGIPGGVGFSQPLPATLIADDISFDRASSAITARGGVEIFFNGARLRASSITYSNRGDRITVEGPLALVDEDGATVIVAEFADLSADLQDGVLQSARIVLDRQMQIAATQIDRSDGRYTQMYQAVASSCEVCFDNPTPLWEIRASRVVHDAVEQQLYFEDAQFRVMGVPVAWLPRMRLPDPTLERATGFLAPSIRADDAVGTQIKVPYFVMIGDHADLTITPWLGLGSSQTFELRYRQAFRSGGITLNGAITADQETDAAFRGYVFADGQFDLPYGITLDFGVQVTSDDSYLTAYGLPDPDLLETFARVSRIERDQLLSFGGTIYESQRDGVDNDTIPTRVLDGTWLRRFTPGSLGGVAEVSLSVLGYQRLESTPGTNPGSLPITADDTPTATDAARISGGIDWQRSTVLGNGIVLTYEGAVVADFYTVAQDVDGDLNGNTSRITPYGAVSVSLPLQRHSGDGVSHLIEPTAQFVWSHTYGGDVPNEDSRLVELDEANLFSLDRFPGSDQREQGYRANLGLSYSRIDPSGWTAGITGGLVLRDRSASGFTPGSGLQGMQSDWLFAAHVSLRDDLQIITRALIGQDLEVTSNELAVNWQGDGARVASTYTWLLADPQEGRDEDLAEWTMDASYALAGAWEAGVSWRYDFVETAPTRAGLTLGYENECVDVEFSVSRRYTETATLDEATEFGLTLELNGFGAGRTGRSLDRSCRR